MIEAFGALEPLWDELYPAEQARMIWLLIDRLDVASEGISITLHAAGTGPIAPDTILKAGE